MAPLTAMLFFLAHVSSLSRCSLRNLIQQQQAKAPSVAMVASVCRIGPFVVLAALLPVARGIDCNNWSMRYKKFLDGVCVCNSTVACDTFPNDYLTLASGEAGFTAQPETVNGSATRPPPSLRDHPVMPT
jgi:hypothetical protein